MTIHLEHIPTCSLTNHLQFIAKLLLELAHLRVDHRAAIRLIGIGLKVILMIPFGLVELSQGYNLGHDRIAPQPRGVRRAL